MATEKFPIKQLYDELGNPFYPLTHIDLILGDKSKLSNIGNTIRKVDLSEFILFPFAGVLELYILNNFIFFYSGIIEYAEGSTIPINQEIIIAKDIPSVYCSGSQIIHFKAMGSSFERINMWLNEKGELVCKITPRTLYKDEYYEEYKSSITSLNFDGQFLKLDMED